MSVRVIADEEELERNAHRECRSRIWHHKIEKKKNVLKGFEPKIFKQHTG